jgi:hypothetical protein
MQHRPMSCVPESSRTTEETCIIISRRKHRLRLGTWNVRTLRDNPGVEEGRTALLILQQAKLRIDILGLSEVRWTGSDHTESLSKGIQSSTLDRPRNIVMALVSA